MLVVDNVTSGYNGVPIIFDVSMRVDKNEIVTIIGPNGSGKSTLLKTVFGILKPMKGSIRFNGKEIAGLKAHKIASLGMAYVPQLENIFPNLTVNENLEIGAYLNDKKFDERVEECFNIFPVLKQKKNEKARNLSGGERQMLAISMALMTNPKLLLLDEPSASLAPKLAQDILKKLVEIRESGKSLLVVEQNARKCLEVSDRGYVMVTGRKVLEGKAFEILQNEEIGKLYLGKK
jgi:ABC-type branched-subunit amino acid transport system ATPase component